MSTKAMKGHNTVVFFFFCFAALATSISATGAVGVGLGESIAATQAE